jgi:single-stranded DNA-specific DHH superfamily exonuclease
MPQINQKQAKEFLDKISKLDTVAIMFHNDLDGFASGIILSDFCEKKGAKTIPIPFTMTDDQNRAIKEIGQANKILIADLAPTEVVKVLEAMKNRQVFYTDHHIKEIELPKEINELRTISDISSSKTLYQILGGREWLKIFSEFADAGWKQEANKKYIDKFLKDNELTFQQFLERYDYKFDRTITYFHKDLKKAFETLNKIESLKDFKSLNKYNKAVGEEINRFITEFESKKEKIGDIYFYYFEPEFPIKSAVINEISYANPNETFIFAVPKDDRVSLSARNQNRKENMVEILKKATENIENANVGGHIPAAGAKVPRKMLQKVRENLQKMAKK